MLNSAAGQFAAFPSTHWSLVGRAGADSSDAQRKALVEVLKRYVPPIRNHLIYRKRINRHQADDLIQDFLADKVLDQEIIGRYQKERGKFRTFLLTAIDRFLIDKLRHDQAGKRFAKNAVSLDDEDAGASNDVAAKSAASFESEWARQVLQQAIDYMKDDCQTTGRPDVWRMFEARILKPLFDNEPPADYETLVVQFKLASPAQAANLLITAKRSFIRALRAVVGSYENDPARIDEEIAELQTALAGGR